MNFDLFSAYVAVGAISELLTTKHGSYGKKVGTAVYLIAIGSVLGVVVPEALNEPVIWGIFVAFGGRVFGKLLGSVIDWVRVKRWQYRQEEELRTARKR